VAASAVTPALYRAWCLVAAGEPDWKNGNVGVEMAECGAPGGANTGADGTDLQRWKFGYDWLGDWESPGGIARNELWTNALAEG